MFELKKEGKSNRANEVYATLLPRSPEKQIFNRYSLRKDKLVCK